MSAIQVGIRIDAENGVAYFGLEEVNQRIAAGGRILTLKPAGAIMHRTGNDPERVSMTLGGCQIDVVFEEA